MTRPSSGRSGLIGLRRQRSGDGRDVVSRGDGPGCLSPGHLVAALPTLADTPCPWCRRRGCRAQ